MEGIDRDGKEDGDLVWCGLRRFSAGVKSPWSSLFYSFFFCLEVNRLNFMMIPDGGRYGIQDTRFDSQKMDGLVG